MIKLSARVHVPQIARKCENEHNQIELETTLVLSSLPQPPPCLHQYRVDNLCCFDIFINDPRPKQLDRRHGEIVCERASRPGRTSTPTTATCFRSRKARHTLCVYLVSCCFVTNKIFHLSRFGRIFWQKTSANCKVAIGETF